MSDMSGFDFAAMSPFNGDLAKLSKDEQRELAELLEARNEYRKQQIVLDEYKIAYLRNPSPANKQQFEDFATLTLRPLREKMMSESLDVVKAAVNVPGLLASLSMLLPLLSQSVNFPLLLAAIGYDDDTIAKVLSKIGDVAGKTFSKGDGDSDDS